MEYNKKCESCGGTGDLFVMDNYITCSNCLITRLSGKGIINTEYYDSDTTKVKVLWKR